MPQPTIPDYRRAALQRIAAAEFLLDQTRAFRLEAMYLCGYAVECGLKALIVERTPRSRRRDIQFRGESGHNFDYLKKQLRRLGCEIPKEVIEGMRPIFSWTTDLRYEVGLRPYEDARRYLDAATCALEWIERSL